MSSDKLRPELFEDWKRPVFQIGDIVTSIYYYKELGIVTKNNFNENGFVINVSVVWLKDRQKEICKQDDLRKVLQ